jgi:hypothetical protein
MNERKPGVYHDIPNDEYHSGPEVSNSGLGDILQSPYHYWARHLNPERPPREGKAGQLEGTLAHCAILEPGELSERYRIGPDVTRSTKVWKEAAAAAEADGVTLIKPDQAATALAQARSVHALPDIAQALARGRPEVSAFWRDDETGVVCRVRPDWVHETDGGGVVLLDVKTYGDASPQEFRRQAARKGYHRQDAMYRDGYAKASGAPVLAFIFVAVEDKYPFAASAVMLDEESQDAGWQQYRHALSVYADCKKNDKWPGYSSGIETIRLPGYALAA